MIEEFRKDEKYLYILGVLLCFSHIISNQIFKIIIITFVFYISYLFNLCNATLLLLVSSSVINYSGSSVLYLFAILPACIDRQLLTKPIGKKRFLFSILIFCLSLASYFLGIDTNPNTMILFWVALITFFNISDQKSESLEFGKYGLLGLMFVLFALVWADKNGGIQILYGRLALGDNIRSLANATAISEILLGFSFFDSKKAKGKFLKIFFLLFGVVVLLLTFSKGALISSGVTLLLLLMRSNISLSKKFLIVLLVAAALIVTMNYVSTGDEFRSDRLSDGIDGFSGRTDIWSAYWQAMKEKISTLLFGFGPGDIKRLGVVTSYSHSLIFDVLFSYGVCGFSVFIGLLLNSVYRCLKSKNKLAIVMSVFPLLLFSTHSTATDVRFYILFGMAVALSVNKNIGMN